MGKPVNTNQPYKISKKEIQIGDVLSEAWQLVNGLKWPVFWLSFFMWGIWLIAVLTFLFLVFFMRLDFHTANIFSKVIPFILFWYLAAVQIMLGVRQSIGLPPKVSLAYADCMRVKGKLFMLLLCAAVVAIIYYCLYYTAKHFLGHSHFLFFLTIVLLFLANIFIVMMLQTFALPLIVTKKSEVQTALLTSWNIMKVHWVNLLLCVIIMSVIMVLSMIPLGIGMIWTVPMAFAMYGILFRNLLGLRKKKPVQPKQIEQEIEKDDEEESGEIPE